MTSSALHTMQDSLSLTKCSKLLEKLTVPWLPNEHAFSLPCVLCLYKEYLIPNDIYNSNYILFGQFHSLILDKSFYFIPCVYCYIVCRSGYITSDSLCIQPVKCPFLGSRELNAKWFPFCYIEHCTGRKLEALFHVMQQV